MDTHHSKSIGKSSSRLRTSMIYHHRSVKTSKLLLKEERPGESQRKWKACKMSSTKSLRVWENSLLLEITSTHLTPTTAIKMASSLTDNMVILLQVYIHTVTIIISSHHINRRMVTSDLDLLNQRLLKLWWRNKSIWRNQISLTESTRSLQATPLIIKPKAKIPNLHTTTPNPNRHGAKKSLLTSPAFKQ